eukprot:2887713-Prorocentrum_lima.AAC.1
MPETVQARLSQGTIKRMKRVANLRPANQRQLQFQPSMGTISIPTSLSPEAGEEDREAIAALSVVPGQSLG